jgi:SAM-dependent methyltransferase
MSAMDGAHRYFGGSELGERRMWTDSNAWLHMLALQWEPAGEHLLAELGDGAGLRAVDLGCGPLGWLRLLSTWVGPTGEVVGTEVTDETAQEARQTVRSEGLSNVSVAVDDVFNSWLPERSFDLVHARFLLAPLGRHEEQLASYRRLLRPGGWLVVEEPQSRTWRFNPPAPACERLLDLALCTAAKRGRDGDIGGRLPGLVRRYCDPLSIRAHVLALPPGHLYRLFPMFLAAALREPIAEAIGAEQLDALFAQGEEELRDPERWCTSFVLVQVYGRVE